MHLTCNTCLFEMVLLFVGLLLFVRVYKMTYLHSYRTRVNQQRVMEEFKQNQNTLCWDMDIMSERMSQLLKTLHAIVHGQEKLRQSVTKITQVVISISNGSPKPNVVIIPEKVVDDHDDVNDLEGSQGDLIVELEELAEIAKVYRALEERLKVMKTSKTFGFDVASICLVPEIVIPSEFKIPDFDKYKGTSCLEAHLHHYCGKTRARANNEPLLIHFFQDSLIRAPLELYM